LKAAHGARRALLAAAVAAAAGCVVAAWAPSMAVVIAGRGLQGLGEGVILALCYALARDVFPPQALGRTFAAYAVAWAAGAVAGPVAGGALTDLVDWRAAFLGLVPLIALFMALVARVLPRDRAVGDGSRPPLARLGFLTVGALALSLAGTTEGRAEVGALLVAALLAFAMTVRLDRRAPHRLFPSVFVDLRHRVGLGLWIITLMFLAETTVHVYVPFLMQTGHGLTPTFIGYFVAIIALAWSSSAVAVSGLTGRAADATVALGPGLVASGLGLSAVALDDVGLAPLAGALVVVGLGFGLSYTFITQRVMAAAPAGEEDVTSGAIPTLGNIGSAFGAAIAGLIGNAAGFAAGIGGPGALAAGQWALAVAAAIAVLPALGALAFVRPGREGT
ncbi:MAG: MFS transporter, partial [Alphaproteobacteria bacterium]